MSADGPLVVVANPTAGRGKAGKLIGRVGTILDELRVSHRVLVTDSPQDMESTCRREAGSGAAIVAVIGGDGTVSCAANGLIGTETALGVLPAGTGDDFARTIGVGRFDAAVKLLASPRVETIDAIRVITADQDRHFVNVAGAGFDSEVNETANAMTIDLGGTGTYLAALVKTLRRFAPARYDIVIDGQGATLDAMLVVVGNAISYGGGMKVLPNAIIDDGRLDLCIVEALAKGAFLRAFPKVYTGSHGSHPSVRLAQASVVEVGANRDVRVYADGEPVGSLPATFRIAPRALRVVVGPRAKGIG